MSNKSNQSITIAIDAMGGDSGAAISLSAIKLIVAKYPNINFLVFGQVLILKQLWHDLPPQVEWVDCEQIVDMGESPALALRHKRRSSMAMAIKAVKSGRAGACVSAGNTGALMALSKYILSMSKGIERPAIMAMLPTKLDKPVYMLDLGANVSNTPTQLYQFAKMANKVVRQRNPGLVPKLALLNVGHEDIKGNNQVKQTSGLIEADKKINYCGYIEGSEILSGIADIVVCDGFVGNIALKSIEGTAEFLLDSIKDGIKTSILKQILSPVVKFCLRDALRARHPDIYNGAYFLGVNGVVIKSHGSASVKAYARAIEVAIGTLGA